MAVGTGNIDLREVCAEIYGTAVEGMSLAQCFASATGTFDPTYEGSKDRLSNFKGYSHAPVGDMVLSGTTETNSSTIYFSATVTGSSQTLRFEVFGGACSTCEMTATIQTLSTDGPVNIPPTTLICAAYERKTHDICLPVGTYSTIQISVASVTGSSGNLAEGHHTGSC